MDQMSDQLDTPAPLRRTTLKPFVKNVRLNKIVLITQKTVIINDIGFQNTIFVNFVTLEPGKPEMTDMSDESNEK